MVELVDTMDLINSSGELSILQDFNIVKKKSRLQTNNMSELENER